MSRFGSAGLVVSLCLISFVCIGWPEGQQAGSGMLAVKPSDGRWEPIPQMRPGAERMVLRRDPLSGGVELLARYPSGYTVPWHWHTANERLVVLEGRFLIESSDHRVELERGGFVYQPGKNVHQVSCISGQQCLYYAYWDGPWDINYVERR